MASSSSSVSVSGSGAGGGAGAGVTAATGSASDAASALTLGAAFDAVAVLDVDPIVSVDLSVPLTTSAWQPKHCVNTCLVATAYPRTHCSD